LDVFNSHSRILIVGTSGSGKSVLARKLAARFALTDIELDALFWEPNWTQASAPVFRARIEAAMAKNAGWVIHGNYSKVRDLTWGGSETVIWLDYPLAVVLWRVMKRSVLRIISREPLWSGNRESLRKTFFSRDSIILWALETHDRNRRQYEGLIQDQSYSHLRVIRLKTPGETERFFVGLNS
jgi:adenylate kinase family enzyme